MTPGGQGSQGELTIAALPTVPTLPEKARSCGTHRVLCGDVCVQIWNDPLNCGGCGIVCPAVSYATSTCFHGECNFEVCIAGRAECDGKLLTGCETDITSDASNCGGCGIMCPAGVLCVDGRCDPKGCTSGTGDCDGNALNGCETNTDFDAANCGGCAIACPAGLMCVDGACKLSMCDPLTEVELAGGCYYLDGSGGADRKSVV